MTDMIDKLSDPTYPWKGAYKGTYLGPMFCEQCHAKSERVSVGQMLFCDKAGCSGWMRPATEFQAPSEVDIDDALSFLKSLAFEFPLHDKYRTAILRDHARLREIRNAAERFTRNYVKLSQQGSCRPPVQTGSEVHVDATEVYIGQRIHFDVQDEQWGRIASDGTVLQKPDAEGMLLVHADTIRGTVLVDIVKVIPMSTNS